jgi:hypothetical protein
LDDDQGLPFDIDPELWIEANGYDGRLYLIGNAHTHPGRMLAWSEIGGDATNVSKHDITDASDAARRWIDEFLSGNEPRPAAYLGIDALAAARPR